MALLTDDVFISMPPIPYFLRALHADPDGPLATMTARWHRFSLPRDRAALLTPGWPIEYGLGIMRFRPHAC